MAIGNQQNSGAVSIDRDWQQQQEQLGRVDSNNASNNNNDLAFCNFKMGCQEIIKDLEKFNMKKTRDIGHCFTKLTDNIPKEIINAPINFCLDYYAEFCYETEKKEANAANEINTGAASAAPVTVTASVDTGVGNNKTCSVIEESVCDKTNTKS